MKKLITILSLVLIFSAPIFANKSEFTWSDMEVKYSNFYEKVLDEYGADRLENLFVICKYAEDNGIQRCTLFTQYKNTPEDFQAFLDRELMGNAARYAFWITFIILGLFGVIMFCYLDNDWLNNL